MDEKQGLIAILDALGAASYSKDDIQQFLQSRALALEALRINVRSKALHGALNERQLLTFTFGDTVLIAYRTATAPTLGEVVNFGFLLRKFQADSLARGILFRGAVAMGSFYANDETNTVMGPAVTDAASWYDKAEWIGISATPHATFFIDNLSGAAREDLDHLFINYEVPMKDGKTVQLRALNWPKIFASPDLSSFPTMYGREPHCLHLVTRGRIPKGTEQKYFHTRAFIARCFRQREEALKANAKKGLAIPQRPQKPRTKTSRRSKPRRS